MIGARQHAAENFSLIFAGGCLAVDAGILPYRKIDVFRAIERCFRDGLESAVGKAIPYCERNRFCAAA